MVVILQTLGGAGLLLAIWWCLAALKRRDMVSWKIVSLGVVLRAGAALALFTVAYLDLPVAREMRDGNGYWFFASDSAMYVRLAGDLLSDGIAPAKSPAYVRLFALAVLVSGQEVMAGVTLNLLLFALTGLLVDRLRGAGDPRAARIANAALAFSPSLFLWSLQPLKDVMVATCIVAFVLACTKLREWFGRPAMQRSRGTVAAICAVLCLVLYLTAGLRWYLALLMLAAVVAVVVREAVSARAVTPVFVVLMLVCALATLRLIAWAASPYMPAAVQRILAGQAPALSAAEAKREIAVTLSGTRWWLNQQGGRSVIQSPVSAGDEPDAPRTNFRSGDASVLLAGAIAWFVPHAIAERAGWIDVGDGRGLDLFANVDTVYFDCFVLWAAVTLVLAVRRKWSTRGVWLPLLVAVPLAAALMYTIPTLGTHVRHRAMVLVLVVTVPVIATRSPEERDPGPVAG